MSEAIASLQRDHMYLSKLLDIFEQQMEAFERGEDVDYDLVERILDYFLSYPEQCHHPKEDLIYARMQEKLGGQPGSGKSLQAEHEDITALTNAVMDAIQKVLGEAELSRNWVLTTSRNFLTAYRRHIELEEGVFFPKALKTLAPEDWADIDARATDREDPLFGEKTEKRFEALRRYLLDLDQIGQSTS